MTLQQSRYKEDDGSPKTITQIANIYSPHKNERGEIENTLEAIEGKIQVIAQELAKFGITDVNSKVDLNDPQILAALVRAIIKSEKLPEETEYYLNLPEEIWDYAQESSQVDIPKDYQVGGQVPQINRSGLIQGEGGPTSDSIPMQAEPNSFIINAPAVQMAGGAEKLDDMVQQQQQTSGFNQFGNPVTGSQGINVSNGEYKVSQPAAKKIGYKKLNKMNNAGKPFVDQIDRRGYAQGAEVPLEVTFGDKTVNVTDEEIKGLAKLLYLEDTRMVIPEDVLGVVINRMNIALNSKKGKDEFIGNSSINFMNLMAKPHAFEPVSMNAVRNGALYFDDDNQHKIDTLQKNNSETLNNLEQVIRNTFNEVNSKTYNNPVGKSLWFQNVEGSDRFDKPSNLTKNVNIGYFNTYSIRHIPQEKGKDKTVEFYEVNPDPEKIIASKQVDPDSTYDTNFHNLAIEFNYSNYIPTPITKPYTESVQTPDEIQPENLSNKGFVNLLDVKPQTEKEEKDKSFVGSNISTGTRTLSQQDWDIPFEKWRQEQVQQ